MKKLLLMICALGLSASIAFYFGARDREYAFVQAQAGGEVIPKLEIKVEIEGIAGSFRAGVSGLEVSCDIVEEVGADGVLRKRPGRVKYGDITLKRGYDGVDGESATALYEWYRDVKQGDFARKSGSVILSGRDGTEVARYNFFESWPCKWKAPNASNTGAVSAIEEISWKIHKVERVR